MVSFKQVLAILPGIHGGVLDKDNDQESMKNVKRFLCIMESMNDKELDGFVEFNISRRVRIARASGTDIEDVNELLTEYKKLSKLFKSRVTYCYLKDIRCPR